MKLSLYSLTALLAALPSCISAASDGSECKCTPDQPCWPTDDEWAAFNKTIGGQLIKTTPVMLPCFTGPAANNATCQYLLTEGFFDAQYQAEQPVGYDYPINETCAPPASALTVPAAKCQLGNSPMYAINVTSEEYITKGIKFATEKNLRVVIKSTGHDFLQRSKGFFGLSIWLYHLRNGFEFDDYNPEAAPGSYNGSTLTIKGAYPWSDLNPFAKEKGVILVGGNQNGPCSTGGWTQGGGHSPVSRNFGMGANQVLSFRVVLASGEIVKASPNENQDLYFALRGGGPGTYGVVTEMTVKTYQTRTVDWFFVELLGNGNEKAPRFLDAMATAYSSFTDLSKAGFGGYGYWATYLTNPFWGYNYTNVWIQSYTILGKSRQEAQELFQQFQDKLEALNLSAAGLTLRINHTTWSTFGNYYDNKFGTGSVVGGVSALSSRLLDSAALTGKRGDIRDFLDKVAGRPGQLIDHTIVHHGLETAPELHLNDSAVQPGWYGSTILDIHEISIDGFSEAKNRPLFDQIRNEVYPLYKALSPDAGTYMNEADFGEANYKEDFYAVHYDRLSEVKAKYDPGEVFYCGTCVGSEGWTVRDDGALCKV